MEIICDAQNALHLVVAFPVDQVPGMEAATADVAVRRDRDAVAGAYVLNCAQRLGDPGHRDADVLAAVRPLRTWAQGADRGAHDRTRFPECSDALRLVGPLSRLRQGRDCFGDAFGVE